MVQKYDLSEVEIKGLWTFSTTNIRPLRGLVATSLLVASNANWEWVKAIYSVTLFLSNCVNGTRHSNHLTLPYFFNYKRLTH